MKKKYRITYEDNRRFHKSIDLVGENILIVIGEFQKIFKHIEIVVIEVI